MSRASARLSSRTVPLEDAPDLLAEAGGHGRLWRAQDGGIVGIGVAARIELPAGLADTTAAIRVRDALSAVDSVDEVGLPGAGPVAMGALPFDPASAGYLVIPRRIVGRSGDTGWVTFIDPEGNGERGREPVGRAGQHRGVGAGEVHAGEGGADRDGAGAGRAVVAQDQAGGPDPSPDHFTLSASMPHEEWQRLVADTVELVDRGELEKVVIARRVEITANRPFVVPEVLERLVSLYPSCMVFSMDGFIGASPELLIRRTGELIESHPLAGTVARSGDTRGDEALVAKLMASPKARHEHGVVVDALVAALEPVCAEIAFPSQPSVLGLRNVSHLASHITGRLAPGSDGEKPTALELVARVHPSPAVGGRPTEAAVRYLQKVEGFDRGPYAGPVGWVDARGDGAWALGIRCAEVAGARARIYAGNGIVAGSVPAEELAETQLKLQALLAALVRP